MTEEIKPEVQIPEKRIAGESLGRYSLIDGLKVYQFSFPLTSSSTFINISPSGKRLTIASATG